MSEKGHCDCNTNRWKIRRYYESNLYETSTTCEKCWGDPEARVYKIEKIGEIKE